MPLSLRFVLFFSVLGTLVVGGHLYLYRRLVRDVTDRPALRRAGGVLLAALALFLVAGRALAALLPGEAALLTAQVQYLWMGLSLHLVLALLGLGGMHWATWRAARRRVGAAPGGARSAGVATVPSPPPVAPTDSAEPPAGEGGVSLERRQFLSRAVAGGALALGGGVAGYGTWRAYHRPEVTEVAVPLRGLPRALDGLTLVHLSDIHVGPAVQRRFMEALVRQVNRLGPDLLVVTGDLVDGRVAELGHAVSALGDVHARFGRFFVTGNHEYYSGADAWSSALERMGVQVLRNRNVSVGEAGGGLTLAGVDDWSSQGVGSNGGHDLAAALAGRRPDQPTVLLAHQPREAAFEEAVAQGVGLQLSGHTHAGQLFPSTLITPFVWKYNAGLYVHGEGRIYVSRGTGFWGPPMRVGSPPEVVKVVLTAA